MSRKYKFNDQESLYFVSFAVVKWADVFIRKEYKDILIQSLEYCQREKGLIVYAYVIMSSHVHLLISKEESVITLSDIMRDMKKYTSMHLLKSIRENPQESRREFLLNMFKQAGEANSNNTNFQFWQQNNHPLAISENDNIYAVLDYIHENPVAEGWVQEPEDYLYSSARNYAEKESVLKIASIYDGEEI